MPLSISVRTTCCSTKNAPCARAWSHSSSRAGNSVDISRASTSGDTRSRLSCAKSSSWFCSSSAVENRRFTSRDSARITIASSAGGNPGATDDGGSASRVTICCSTPYSVSSMNGRRPVVSSYRIVPIENTSLRRSSTPLPRHCSGDMYEILPLSPTADCDGSPPARAIPKSTSFTAPS